MREIANGKTEDEFRAFHNFVFTYHMFRPGQRTLEIAAAEAVLTIELYRRFPDCRRFVDFLKASHKDHINRDQWNLMIDVFVLLDKNGKYDVDSSCKDSAGNE